MNKTTKELEPKEFFISKNGDVNIMIQGLSRDGYLRSLNMRTGSIEHQQGNEEVLLLGYLEMTKGVIKPNGFRFLEEGEDHKEKDNWSRVYGND